MAVTITDLIEHGGPKTPTTLPRPFLCCVICGGEYSANPADYFLASPDDVFRCCDELLILVKRTTRLEVLAD